MYPNQNVLDFIILSLAIARFTYLMTEEDGPFNIFFKIRYLVGFRKEVEYNAIGQPIPTSGCVNHFCKGFICFNCSSVWYSALFLTGYMLIPEITMVISTWLALSGLAMVVRNWL